MARQPRLVVPGVPHHVTQRGNFGVEVFTSDAQRQRYLDWLLDDGRRYGLATWAYCLMGNHVHLIVVPEEADSLGRALASVHMKHAQAVNREAGRTGHLWQGRYSSCQLDGEHLLRAALHVERNPVRTGLVPVATAWPWSSARAHALGAADPLVDGADWPTDELRRKWAGWLAAEPTDAEQLRLRLHRGLPLGDEAFVARLERQTGRRLRPGRRGRPKSSPGR